MHRRMDETCMELICMNHPADTVIPGCITETQGLHYCASLEEESTARCHGIEPYPGLLPLYLSALSLSHLSCTHTLIFRAPLQSVAVKRGTAL